MSYLVYVRHFLKPGAAREFDEAFERHRALLSRRAGFVSLRRLTPAAPDDQDQVVVLLEFTEEEALRAWRASEEHAAVAENYRRLWSAAPQTEFFSAATTTEAAAAQE